MYLIKYDRFFKTAQGLCSAYQKCSCTQLTAAPWQTEAVSVLPSHLLLVRYHGNPLTILQHLDLADVFKLHPLVQELLKYESNKGCPRCPRELLQQWFVILPDSSVLAYILHCVG